MVGTPFQFSEPGVTTKGNPVDYAANKRVLGGLCGKFSNVGKHAVGDHLLRGSESSGSSE